MENRLQKKEGFQEDHLGASFGRNRRWPYPSWQQSSRETEEVVIRKQNGHDGLIVEREEKPGKCLEVFPEDWKEHGT